MTRTLSLLGAALPSGLMPAVANNNEAGFWEPLSVAGLNDEMLHALDSDWDDVFAFRPRPYLSNFDRVYLGRAVELLEKEFNGSELIVLKDPRISVLTSFWERALREAGYETHYVIMVRNPLEVSESLRARDGFPREKSFLLWSSYMIAADRDTRECRRTFVSFDQLMGDWRSVRRRIEEGTGVPFPRNTAAAANEIDRHLDRRLRHHETASQDLFSRSDVPEEVKTLYRIFSAACEGADVDSAAVEAVRAELEKMDSLVGPLLADLRASTRRLEKDVSELRNAHECAESRANDLENQLAKEREEQSLQLGKERQEHQEQVAALSTRLAVLETERNLLFSEAEVRTRELDELAHRLGVAEAARDEYNAQLLRERDEHKTQLLREREEHVAQLRTQGDEHEQKLAELASDIAAVRTERDRLVSDAQQKAIEFDELSAVLTAATTESREARRQVARLVEQLRDREVELAATKAENDAITERIGIADEALTRVKREVLTLGRAAREQEMLAGRNERQLSWLRQVEGVVTASTRGWRNLMPPAWRRRRQLRALREAGLFDAKAYLARYSDVAAAGADPLRHYISHGMSEDRQPGVSLD